MSDPTIEIGGLEPIVESLKESIIYPLSRPELFASASGLLGAPKRCVLLYGPPGKECYDVDFNTKPLIN